jgi:predicted RNA-binding Zn-ribbon protein involved in translation (DUF1610 family)
MAIATAAKTATATLRIVKAPHTWQCARCGKEIPATSECAKQASRILCLECLMAGLPTKITLACEPVRPARPAQHRTSQLPPLDIPHLRQVYGIPEWFDSPICGWAWLQYHDHPQNIEYHIEINAYGVHSTITLKQDGLKLFGQIAKALLHRPRKRKERSS